MSNKITISQWEELMKMVLTSAAVENQIKDIVYSGKEKTKNGIRFFCYDNLDRYDVPGLDFSLLDSEDVGLLTVYNGSEQARAPITFEQGVLIATNFFNEIGYDMSETIVSDWLDDNKSIF